VQCGGSVPFATGYCSRGVLLGVLSRLIIYMRCMYDTRRVCTARRLVYLFKYYHRFHFLRKNYPVLMIMYCQNYCSRRSARRESWHPRASSCHEESWSGSILYIKRIRNGIKCPTAYVITTDVKNCIQDCSIYHARYCFGAYACGRGGLYARFSSVWYGVCDA